MERSQPPPSPSFPEDRCTGFSLQSVVLTAGEQGCPGLFLGVHLPLPLEAPGIADGKCLFLFGPPEMGRAAFPGLAL